MNAGEQQLAIDLRLMFFGFLGIISTATILFGGPVLVGRYCGHGWGLALALATVAAWTWLKLKLPTAPTTLAAWIIGLLFLTVMACYELSRLLQVAP